MTSAEGPAATTTAVRRPPGPRAIKPLRPLVAAACGLGYLVAGEWLIRRLFATYGPIVSIPLPGIPVVLLKDPELVKQVFTEKPDILLGGKGVRPSALIYGTGSMFVQEEPEHLRRRKLLTPPLHGKALENYRPIIEDSTRQALATWPTDEPFTMLRAARDLALDVIVRVMFGVEDPGERSRLGRPLRDAAGSGVLGTTDPARRPALGGRLEAVAQARPRKPGRRRPADADDRRPAAGRRPARPHRHHVVAADRPRRGRRVSDGQRDPRRSRHPGAGRPRDDRHHAGLDDRPVAAPPRRAGQGAGRSRSGRIDVVHAGGDQRNASHSTPLPLHRSLHRLRLSARRVHRACPRHGSSRTSAKSISTPRHTTIRTSSGRSDSSTRVRRPMRGFRSAAVSSVASARASAFSS